MLCSGLYNKHVSLCRCTLDPDYNLTALLTSSAKQQLCRAWGPHLHKMKPGKLYVWDEDSSKKGKKKSMRLTALPLKQIEEILGRRWVGFLGGGGGRTRH